MDGQLYKKKNDKKIKISSLSCAHMLIHLMYKHKHTHTTPSVRRAEIYPTVVNICCHVYGHCKTTFCLRPGCYICSADFTSFGVLVLPCQPPVLLNVVYKWQTSFMLSIVVPSLSRLQQSEQKGSCLKQLAPG